MSGAQSHRSFIRRLVIWIAVPAGLASPFLVHGAVSSFRDWLRGVKRYDAQDGFFTLWTGVWVPHADLDLGAGTTVRIYAGAENFRGSLGYAILVNGKELVDGCGFGALGHDLPEGHLTDLHFSVVPSADRNLIGVVEDSQPEVILIAYDHRTGLAWPHDRQSGRIQPPADDTGEEPCVHRNRNMRSWEDRIIRAFRTKDPVNSPLKKSFGPKPALFARSHRRRISCDSADIACDAAPRSGRKLLGFERRSTSSTDCQGLPVRQRGHEGEAQRSEGLREMTTGAIELLFYRDFAAPLP